MYRFNLVKAQKFIHQTLGDVGIHQVMHRQGIYIGGSLPLFSLCCTANHLSIKPNLGVIHDIDVYTQNWPSLAYHLSNSPITNLKRLGVNVKFNVRNAKLQLPIQVITAKFNSFQTDILGEYDCDMLSVGYSIIENKFIIHPRFENCILNNCTEVIYHKTNPYRLEKLKQRARDWLNVDMKLVKDDTRNQEMRAYFIQNDNDDKPVNALQEKKIGTLQEVSVTPYYLQIFHNLYDCIGCKTRQNYLLCDSCRQLIEKTAIKYSLNKTMVLGAKRGFGKIFANYLEENLETKILRTSRTPVNYDNYLRFSLENKKMSPELIEQLMNSDVIVMNAYSTLENDEKIWTTTIETFDRKLLNLRFKINVIGYANFLQQFIKYKKIQSSLGKLHPCVLVYMDANETRMDGNKIFDNRHLELNICKTSVKQIFYTNASLLASLGVITLCYDVGWLSYHGVSVEKIRSKSQFLISPRISAIGLSYYISETYRNFEQYLLDGKYIYDANVYQYIDIIMQKYRHDNGTCACNGDNNCICKYSKNKEKIIDA